jgi:DNA-binding beta-propeller fold protein YncE
VTTTDQGATGKVAQRHAVGWAALGWAVLSMAACAAGGLAVNAARAVSLTPAARAGFSSALATCPSSQPVSSLPAFARTDVALIPDDLTVDANGDVWVTVTAQGSILDFKADGTLRQNIPDPNGPEGIVVMADGTVVADQLTSRVDRLGADGRLAPFLKLPNRPKRLPVDGLGFDVPRRRLLVPNSPEGTLLTTPLKRALPRVLATGLGRPVAATVGADGSIYVAAESKVGLVRVPANGGTAKRVGTLSNLDEALSIRGLLYTTGAGDGTVRAVDPATGVDRVLATGGHQLQGLAALPDGRLLVIDSVARTISFVSSCP